MVTGFQCALCHKKFSRNFLKTFRAPFSKNSGWGCLLFCLIVPEKFPEHLLTVSHKCLRKPSTKTSRFVWVCLSFCPPELKERKPPGDYSSGFFYCLPVTLWKCPYCLMQALEKCVVLFASNSLKMSALLDRGKVCSIVWELRSEYFLLGILKKSLVWTS